MWSPLWALGMKNYASWVLFGFVVETIELQFECQLFCWGHRWVTQHPPVHHPKNPVLGFHGWDETVPQGSVYLVSGFFFPLPLIFFLGLFFSRPPLVFLVPPSLNPILFLWTRTYSSNLPPFQHPTHLPPSLPPICAHFHRCSSCHRHHKRSY
jgi:hypothetical protein